MNCTYSDQVTDAYLSGDIENPEWRTHLSMCPECAAKLGSVAQERVRRDFSFERLISQTKQLYDGSDNAVTLEVARLRPSQSLHKRQPA